MSRPHVVLGACLVACSGPPQAIGPRCVDDWPAPGDETLRSSLDVEPAVTMTRRLFRGVTSDGIAVSAERVAITAGARLSLFDRLGTLVRDRVSASLESFSAPVVGPDGTFYVAGNSVYAIAPDGEWRWITPLTSVRPVGARAPVLAGAGVLVTAASDGRLHALDLATGEPRWTREIGTNAGAAAALVGAFGPTVLAFVKDRPELQLYDAGQGTPLGAPRASPPLYVIMAGPRIGVVAQRQEASPGAYPRMTIAAFDRCGEARWTVPPTRAQWPALIAPGDLLLVAERDDARGSEPFVSVLSPEGTRLGEPRPAAPPVAIGADGVVYGFRCEGPGQEGPSTLHAYAPAPALAPLWSLPLGPGCPRTPPVIASDGTMYFTWYQGDVSELVAVQTPSPGLATTGWPARRPSTTSP